MREIVKKATRESFGEAVTALAETNLDIVVLDADLAEATKTGIFKKNILTGLLTAALPSAT